MFSINFFNKTPSFFTEAHLYFFPTSMFSLTFLPIPPQILFIDKYLSCLYGCLLIYFLDKEEHFVLLYCLRIIFNGKAKVWSIHILKMMLMLVEQRQTSLSFTAAILWKIFCCLPFWFARLLPLYLWAGRINFAQSDGFRCPNVLLLSWVMSAKWKQCSKCESFNQSEMP